MNARCWSVAPEDAQVIVKVGTAEGRMDVVFIGAGSGDVSLDEVRSTLDVLPVVIEVSDGFHLATQERTVKRPALDVEGTHATLQAPAQMRVGGNANIELSFIDPETGKFLDGKGSDRWSVRFASNIETLCREQWAHGTLGYFPTREGQHVVAAILESRVHAGMTRTIKTAVRVEGGAVPEGRVRYNPCTTVNADPKLSE